MENGTFSDRNTVVKRSSKKRVKKPKFGPKMFKGMYILIYPQNSDNGIVSKF